jgi:flagellar hook-length control protein FliK
MTNLPINISNSPAKPAAKIANNDDVAQQNPQGFGNVLARQVADSVKPAKSASGSSADASAQATEQDSAETGIANEPGNSIPADMLAALLAQQSQISLPQSDAGTDTDPASIMQAAVSAQADFNPQLALAGATAATGNAAGNLISSKPNLSGKSVLHADGQIPQTETTAKSINASATSIKPTDISLPALSGNSPSARGNVLSELTTTQQPGILPFMPIATSPSTQPQAGISTPVTQPGWGDEFGQQITWLATQKLQSAELHLNPPQLGPLDVLLKLNGDQATAVFSSPHAAVRDAIEQALPKLREILADSGIMLGNASVSDQAAKNQQENPSRHSAARASASAADGSLDANLIAEARVATISRHQGMVDTFA